MFRLYWCRWHCSTVDVNKCRRVSHRYPKRVNNNNKVNRTRGAPARREIARGHPRRTAIRRKFRRGFNCRHLSPARATMSARAVCKKTNVSGSILRGRAKGATRGRGCKRNARCTRVPGVSKGNLLLMAYWNGMSTVIKRDGPTTPWRSPLNVQGYIRARERRDGRAAAERSRGGRKSTDRFLSLCCSGYIVRERAREGSIKIISDA